MIRDEYSIETRTVEIFDHRTKEYFREVVSSYQQGNWRSAVVMLWSVAVCDIIYKLQYLKDISGDDVGKEILEEIEKLQEESPRSPDWEINLIERIEERTRLLDLADLDHLKHLQKQRHLAAPLRANLRPNSSLSFLSVTFRALIEEIDDRFQRNTTRSTP